MVRPAIRVLLAGALLLVLTGVIAPFINAAYFGGSIKQALKASLGRDVQFEKVYFTLFAGPGFSLERVTISEDPRYGIEPFAFVPDLKARLRLDKLLLGRIQFTSLRLVEPSLNMVKRNDGTWNVVTLMARLSAPRRAPLSLFPAFEVEDGRVDFKFGDRKTTFYLSGADLTIYPQRSGKIYIQFSGSPARTDRAGEGFGHFRGNVNWFLDPSGERANQLAAEVTLDPSNLSELTTLLEGQDIGVHGTVSSALHLQGPASSLSVRGELRLNDVHRWDLLPARGEDWSIPYSGDVNLMTHSFELATLPPQNGQPSPVALRVRVSDFLTSPGCSVVADLKNAPLASLLPLALRMGVPLPAGARVSGALDGAIGYSNTAGWSGGLAIKDAEAALPGAPTVRSALANLTVSADRVHFDPAIVQTKGGGTLQMGGNYYLTTQRADAQLQATDVPVGDLKATSNAWFGGIPALTPLTSGFITGQFSYTQTGATVLPSTPVNWSGVFDFDDATVEIPGLATPLQQAQGRVNVSDSGIEVDRVTAALGEQFIHANYRYASAARHPEHVHIDLSSADLSEIEGALTPALQPNLLWARLHLPRRTVPAWLSSRNAEGDLVVHQLTVQQIPVGSMSAHFLWQGTDLQLPAVTVQLPKGLLLAHGDIDLAAYLARWRMSGKISRFPWKSGWISAEGNFQTAGTGKDSLRDLQGSGTFTGEALALSSDAVFDTASGLFQFSFADGWPDLRFSNVEAMQDGDDWSGEATTHSDGKLLVDLAHAAEQMHIVSTLAGENVTTAAPADTRDASREQRSRPMRPAVR